MGQGQRTDLPPMPLCGCGCRQRVRRRFHRFLYGHVPVSVHAEGGRKGGQTRRFLARRKLFNGLFAQMVQGQRTITKAAVFDAFAVVHRAAYEMGYHACEDKWRDRTRKDAA